MNSEPIKLKIHTPSQWKGQGIVAYFQATIAGGYAQRFRIVNEEGVFHDVHGETEGVLPSEFGKQFYNEKQNVDKSQCRKEYNFRVSVDHNDGTNWKPSRMKCGDLRIENDAPTGKDNAAFGIVISDDRWPGDTDFNDCVVIISLYKGRE